MIADTHFRGKQPHWGKDSSWILGSYIEYYNGKSDVIYSTVDENFYAVDGRTVGQYIGLEDCEDFCIYEGDIVKNMQNGRLYGILWNQSKAEFAMIDLISGDIEQFCGVTNGSVPNILVIGNNWDTPELLNDSEA